MLCDKCIHAEVCKYIKDYKEVDDLFNKLEDKDTPIIITIQCKQFVHNSNAITEAKDDKTDIKEAIDMVLDFAK